MGNWGEIHPIKSYGPLELLLLAGLTLLMCCDLFLKGSLVEVTSGKMLMEKNIQIQSLLGLALQVCTRLIQLSRVK